MELTTILFVLFFAAASFAESRREKKERAKEPRGREYTPEQRRAMIRIYNEFYS